MRQISLNIAEGPPATKVKLVPDGWWHCNICGQDFEDVGKLCHVNFCTRFKCVLCGGSFSILPDPLKKQFGSVPKCLQCRSKPDGFPLHIEHHHVVKHSDGSLHLIVEGKGELNDSES